MKKYLLTFEFRYMSVPKNEDFSGYTTKTITIGVYDTISDAVNIGNEQLTILSKTFDVRDSFKVRGLFGNPDTLISNTCTKDKIKFFGKITTLDFKDISEMVNETVEATKKYETYITNQ